MIQILLVEDNEKLRTAMKRGLEETTRARVIFDCGSAEEILTFFEEQTRKIAKQNGEFPDAVLMDVQLAGVQNGIQAAMAIRNEFPRFPVVFYSIQDEDEYYRAFRQSGILSHYAYVKKSNFLLPQMVLPLLEDAIRGHSFIDPEIADRVNEVWQRDEQSPLALLEPNEQKVARMLAKGMTNEQIAAVMGFRDKRTISRINGQIYCTWGLNTTTIDEKVARTRAVIIAQQERMITWDEHGNAMILNENGEQIPWR